MFADSSERGEEGGLERWRGEQCLPEQALLQHLELLCLALVVAFSLGVHGEALGGGPHL